MSEDVTKRGKLKPISLKEGQTINELALEELNKQGLKYNERVYDSPLEHLLNNLYFHYLFANDILYQIIEFEEIDDYFCELDENTDGTISFLTHYYNGSASLNEILEDELKEKYKNDN